MKRNLPAVCILLLFLSLMGTMIYIMDYQSKASVENLLIAVMPWTLRLNFFLLVATLLFLAMKALRRNDPPTEEQNPPCNDAQAEAMGKNRSGFRRLLDTTFPLSPAFRREAILFCLIIAGAFLAVSLIPVQMHRLFYDEDIYASIGMNIGVLHQAAMCNYGLFDYGDFHCAGLLYNKDPNGWPFLISLAFQAFGIDETYAFVLNNLLFAGSTAIVYLIVRLISGRAFPSAIGSLAYVLIPHNLIWSNTVAAEPASAFFGGLTALFLFAWLRLRRNIFLLLFVLAAPLACQMRAESGLIALWAVITVAIAAPRIYLERRTWLLGFVALVLLVPHLLHLYAMSGHSWGAEGAKFSSAFFPGNLRVNGPYFLTNGEFPVTVTILAFLGLFAAGGQRRQTMSVTIWFILFWGIFLFFYAGSYRYGTDVRFALVAFMPLSILAGLGGGKLLDWVSRIRRFATDAIFTRRYAAALIVLILFFSWMPFLPMIRTVGQEAWGARYDHFYAREFIKKIPERSVILTHNPNMFHLWGRSAIQAHIGLISPETVHELSCKVSERGLLPFQLLVQRPRGPESGVLQESPVRLHDGAHRHRP